MATASAARQKKYKPPKQPLRKRLDPLLAALCDADTVYHLLRIDLLRANGRIRAGVQRLLFQKGNMGKPLDRI